MKRPSEEEWIAQAQKMLDPAEWRRVFAERDLGIRIGMYGDQADRLPRSMWLPYADHVCWLWKGNVDSKGYPRIRTKGKLEYVHRLTWATVNGPIPAGAAVRRTCGSKRCIRPGHLALVSKAAPLWGLGPDKKRRKSPVPRGEKGV